MYQALADLEKFAQILSDSDKYSTERRGEFLVWRADHPSLGKITGVQGAEAEILLITQRSSEILV